MIFPIPHRRIERIGRQIDLAQSAIILDETAAYFDGYTHGDHGGALDANPYPTDSEAWLAWRIGHHQAEDHAAVNQETP